MCSDKLEARSQTQTSYNIPWMGDSANFSINSELNHRLGMAKGDLDALDRVWKTANLGLKKKTGCFLGTCDCTLFVLSAYSFAAQS